ncbi:MAG: hypothetical protein MUF15_01545 [Acidobacteria bacterium]|jgi:hypothetical protein|nr:hypothetical protein [Acidobacteriota bacterium]
MLSIAHIINPVNAHNPSDLVIAQPITFETIKAAKEFANDIDVNLYAIQDRYETPIHLPGEFINVPGLKRTISSVKKFKQKRKLPLIKDILDALYKYSNAEYMIYTNVDIALQPYFYQAVSRLIQKGYDAFIINRRTIPGTFKTIAEIPQMLAEIGEKHQGWDCFVFHRSLYSKFKLRKTIIGAGWFGRVMITNMTCFAKQFEILEDLHLTFHIGNEKAWKDPLWDDYTEHNKNECRRILRKLDRKYGPFDRSKLPGRFFSQLELKDQKPFREKVSGLPKAFNYQKIWKFLSRKSPK